MLLCNYINICSRYRCFVRNQFLWKIIEWTSETFLHLFVGLIDISISKLSGKMPRFVTFLILINPNKAAIHLSFVNSAPGTSATPISALSAGAKFFIQMFTSFFLGEMWDSERLCSSSSLVSAASDVSIHYSVFVPPQEIWTFDSLLVSQQGD